eukprot:9422860-Pyramimonas_sp.AAC.1
MWSARGTEVALPPPPEGPEALPLVLVVLLLHPGQLSRTGLLLESPLSIECSTNGPFSIPLVRRQGLASGVYRGHGGGRSQHALKRGSHSPIGRHTEPIGTEE